MRKSWIGLLIALIALPALAADAPQRIEWRTVDGGGGVSVGMGYQISGTAGQPDAGVLIGNGYQVRGGVLAASAGRSHNRNRACVSSCSADWNGSDHALGNNCRAEHRSLPCRALRNTRWFARSNWRSRKSGQCWR